MEEILQRIKVLATDREHGAAQIYRKAALILLEAFSQGEFGHTDILNVVKALIGAQPSMAPIINLCNRILLFIEKGDLKGARGYLEKELTESHNIIQKISYYLVEFLKASERIVVFSYSSIAVEAMISSGVMKPVLTHLGHPIGDGKKSAELLSSKGFDVILTSDLALPGMLKEGDLVLTGCDAVSYPEWVNRAGTFAISLAAKERRVPVVVVTERNKQLPSPLAVFLKLEDAPAKELLDETNFRISHRYFERIPLDLVHKIITQEGVFAPQKLKYGWDIKEEVSELMLLLESDLTQ
jgi:translation initiation factor 2B subunit (eIF-2B alpha/beta/delta family)